MRIVSYFICSNFQTQESNQSTHNTIQSVKSQILCYLPESLAVATNQLDLTSQNLHQTVFNKLIPSVAQLNKGAETNSTPAFASIWSRAEVSVQWIYIRLSEKEKNQGFPVGQSKCRPHPVYILWQDLK